MLMFKRFNEKAYLITIYLAIAAIFIVMFISFTYIENKQEKTIYNFVYTQKIAQNKKDIKLETYAALSFIDSYTKLIISNTYENLVNKLKVIKQEVKQPLTREQITLLENQNGIKLALFFDNDSNSVDFLNIKYCKSYSNNIISEFSDISLKICDSPTIKIGDKPEQFLVATTRLTDNATLVAYKPMLEIENKIMHYIFPKLQNMIFKDKNKDSYFFIVKILNLNGGNNFAMNIYNKSLGVSIGKTVSSNGVDIKGNRYREKYLKGLRKNSETYSEYWYPSPSSNKPSLKISFRKYYKPLRWMVGTGFYADKIKQEAALFTKDMFNRLKSIQVVLFILYLITILIIYFINAKFLSVAKEDSSNITQNISDKIAEIKPVDTDKLHLERFKTIAETLNNFSKTLVAKEKKIEQNRIEFLKTFANIVEVRDVYTKGHSQRVARYAKEIARILNINKQKRYDLYVAGLLHDLGKVAIPDNILLKPGRLSEYEYKIMKYHPEFSYDLVKDIEFFKGIAIFIRQHHERCDGSGYPDGLVCEKITLEGRILAIADVFDALTTTRPYRDAFSIEKAIDIMKEMALDRTIIEKAEPFFKDIYLEENEIYDNVSSKVLDVEKSRFELFGLDTFTGFYKIKSLIDFMDKLMENGVEFYLFVVDIKKLKKINYMFGYEKGNELIIKFADAIKGIEQATFKSRIGSNYFAFIYTGKKPLDIKNRLIERLNSIYVNDHKGEFFIAFLPSSNIKNAEELIYLAEMQIESMKFSLFKNSSV